MHEPQDLSGVLEEVRPHTDGTATVVFRDSLGRRFKILFPPQQLRQLQHQGPPARTGAFDELIDELGED